MVKVIRRTVFWYDLFSVAKDAQKSDTKCCIGIYSLCMHSVFVSRTQRSARFCVPKNLLHKERELRISIGGSLRVHVPCHESPKKSSLTISNFSRTILGKCLWPRTGTRTRSVTMLKISTKRFYFQYSTKSSGKLVQDSASQGVFGHLVGLSNGVTCNKKSFSCVWSYHRVDTNCCVGKYCRFSLGGSQFPLIIWNFFEKKFQHAANHTKRCLKMH